ncbi:ATP-binding protein [Calditerrivibrio nitroreducens]|uniref:AAA-ATPase n=1 Tax=Calditerrivibrio nitroreducens (strain DSM 19672 / NBRC 101217 / Yu37-1) TaxID=768670 RepID=E4TKC5_CALNY|nr:ATP-binding protein [Calditerrivibrio nitroreducens]ADR19997.1 AAA-ATPase [Calditerrivibrio nitroreducens DSM 19672]
MKKLPIGISTLQSIREDNCYYVDKTPFVKKLVDNGKYYFLSRPRRFGKSLLVDTIKQAFLGNRELFKGLYLENNWDWEKKYPVIHIDFGGGVVQDAQDLKEWIIKQLKRHMITYNVSVEEQNNARFIFTDLIISLKEIYKNPVVVLVDEYDKPILDNIDDTEKAIEIREVLKDFYSVLKASDQYLKLVFLTGVSRFSKVSIFSGLNQLQDITLSPAFATICGYTQSELETVFSDRLEGVELEKLRYWYNGYSWLGDKVYNPFDVLLFLSEKIFRPYWFETGTPTFLMEIILNNKVFLPKLEEIKASDEILANLDVDFLKIENLLFQSGYLTIKETKKLGLKTIYILTYPNFEVKMSFNNFFLSDILPVASDKEEVQNSIVEAIEENSLENLKTALYSFFASIPNDWYRKNDLDSYEGFYASVVYALFTGSGLNTRSEDTTNLGKIDLTVLYQDRAYIIEFKVVEKDSEGKALGQIKEKRYYEKYTDSCREINLIGIEFSKEKRNVVYFEYETLER